MAEVEVEARRGLEMTEDLRNAIGAEGPDEGMAPSNNKAASDSSSPAPARRRSKQGSNSAEGVRQDEEEQDHVVEEERNGEGKPPTKPPRRIRKQHRPQPQEEQRMTIRQMYDSLIMGICRPPRMVYEKRALGPSSFALHHGLVVHRTDFEVTNTQGKKLACSIWKPENLEERGFPCVICLHGNSSSRLEPLKSSVLTAVALAKCAVVGFDFSGCGVSEGDYVSLGWFEHMDAIDVIEKVRRMGANRIVLWGRSMGAVTALMVAQKCGGNHKGALPPLAGLVLDSAFSSFKALAHDITSRGLVRVPGFAVSAVLGMIRRSVKKRARFDLFKVDPLATAHLCSCPALFWAAEGDELVPPWHGEDLEAAYGGPSLGLRFDGTHNSARPPILYALANTFITAVTRRERHPVDIALHLIEKTAVISSHEEMELGHPPRHPFRYGDRDPQFIHVGHGMVHNVAGAADALTTSLDTSLAAREAEEYLMDELIAVAVGLVEAELALAHRAQDDTNKWQPVLLDTVSSVQTSLSAAQPHCLTWRPRHREPTSWEAIIRSELDDPTRTLQQSHDILSFWSRLAQDNEATIDATPTAANDTDNTAGGVADPSRWATNPKSPSMRNLRDNNRVVPPTCLPTARMCCYDPKAMLLQQGGDPTVLRERQVAAIATEFFQRHGPWGEQEGGKSKTTT